MRVSTRREFLGFGLRSAAGVGLLLQTLPLPGCGMGGMGGNGRAWQARNRLRLPADLQGGRLEIARTRAEVWPGRPTTVLTYQAGSPGPVIRARSGEEVAIEVKNGLDEPTNIHWHGLIVPADMDGHPRDVIAPGASFTYRLPVAQRPATVWYHPHPEGRTAAQVYLGLAGFFLIEDPRDAERGLPTGSRDVVLCLQDRRYADGALIYEPSQMDVMTGYLGDEILVNGTPEAYHEVENAWQRFRILNGCNARVVNLAFEPRRPFRVVGTDGGLLEAPVQVDSVTLGPAERVEVVVDLSGDAPGTSVLLTSLAFDPGTGGMAGMGGPAQGTAMPVLRLDVVPRSGDPGRLPSGFDPIARLDPGASPTTRLFELTAQAGAMAPGMHRINGQVFDADRVDLEVPFGALEVWEFRNLSDEIHPMHVHGAHFQVLDRDSDPDLPANDLGWKDSILVWPNETVRIAIRFEQHRGEFVMHCHNLEHEDDGMMLNLKVV